MVGKVLGIQKVDFTSNDERITGTKLHISYHSPYNYVEGDCVKAIFISSDGIDVSHVRVGSLYDFVYVSDFGSKPRLTKIDVVYDED